MNMMQNSSLLVAQASAIKNGASTKQPNETLEKQGEGESFKQVLSKQVEQESFKRTGEKVHHAQHQVNGGKAPSNGKGSSDVDEMPIDAQGLALAVTAKTIEDVTDGEVVLDSLNVEVPTQNVASQDVTPQDVAPQDAAQETNVATFTLVNMLAADYHQPKLVGEQFKAVPAARVGNELSPVKQALVNVDVTVDMKASAASVKGKVEAPLVEGDQLTNSQLTHSLGAEKNTQFVKELSPTQPVLNVPDANALATMAVQAAVKPSTQVMPTVEQVGFSNLINAAPGKPGWSEAIGQKVVWMVGAAEQSATLTLNPKDLGPLQVIIHVNNEKADATFITENPEVRKALEEGMSTLRHSMGQAGVELGQANVNTSKQQQEFQQANQARLAHQSADNPTDVPAGELSNRPVVLRESNGLVDTFA